MSSGIPYLGKGAKIAAKKKLLSPSKSHKKTKKNTRPYQRRQLQRHSTLFNYSRFYGIDVLYSPQEALAVVVAGLVGGFVAIGEVEKKWPSYI